MANRRIQTDRTLTSLGPVAESVPSRGRTGLARKGRFPGGFRGGGLADPIGKNPWTCKQGIARGSAYTVATDAPKPPCGRISQKRGER